MTFLVFICQVQNTKISLFEINLPCRSGQAEIQSLIVLLLSPFIPYLFLAENTMSALL
jgi:hypothetical protein